MSFFFTGRNFRCGLFCLVLSFATMIVWVRSQTISDEFSYTFRMHRYWTCCYSVITADGSIYWARFDDSCRPTSSKVWKEGYSWISCPRDLAYLPELDGEIVKKHVRFPGFESSTVRGEDCCILWNSRQADIDYWKLSALWLSCPFAILSVLLMIGLKRKSAPPST